MASESSIIFGVYIAYAVATMVVLRWRPSLTVALAAMFFGWLFLPVEIFPPETITAENFTVNVIGTALPSNALIAKAWVVPLAVLVSLALAMPRAFHGFRLQAVDIGMLAFCLSPVMPFAGGMIAASDALAQTLYLTGAWGGTWAIGRILLSSLEGRVALTQAIIASGLLLLPVAVLEGVYPAWLYSAVYGPHPFQLEGILRYFGFRPLGFFEHGNQYGIWMAIAALAATFRCLGPSPRQSRDIAIAAALITGAIVSQSVGAIILLGLGCAWLIMSNNVRRLTVIAAALLLASGGAAYLSGKLPVERWAYYTKPGQTAVAALRDVGRLSLAYRVRRDQMALPILFSRPLTGYGAWDWWRPMKSRPWGLPLLIGGQYGLLSLLVLVIVMMAGSVRQLYRGRSSILALVVMVAAVDAWLNSFIYFPAILASAALAVPLRRAFPGTERLADVAEEAAEPPLGRERPYGA